MSELTCPDCEDGTHELCGGFCCSCPRCAPPSAPMTRGDWLAFVGMLLVVAVGLCITGFLMMNGGSLDDEHLQRYEAAKEARP